MEPRTLLTVPHPVDLSTLDGTNGFRIDGIDRGDFSGGSVSGAGDVNGDGIDDVIIGAHRAGVPFVGSIINAGESYVVFGQSTGFASALDLSTLDGTNGFRIDGIFGSNDRLGRSVSGAGDVNGDGFDDVIVGAYGTDAGTGKSYVVFGKSTGFASALDLTTLDGTNGFRIDGIDSRDFSGGSVSGAGDVNGDGIDDLIVGARGADSGGDSFAGESYVVFGKSTGFASTLDLSTLDGTNGFRIDGIDSLDYSGISVSGAGDVNGDGIDDVIVGAERGDPGGDYNAGESYVVFGKSTGFASALALSTLDGTTGFRIDGIDSFDYSGRSVSGAGDVNGDGFDDVIVGARSGDPGGKTNAGESYVVFGKSTAFASSLDLSTLDGTNGFRIDGIDIQDYSGRGVSGAGDVNGDGFDDVIVGARGADPGGDSFAGESYVVYGKPTGFASALDLSTLDGTNGFRIDGIDAGDQLGRSVSGAGDVNGDGIDDLIIGAYGADPGGDSTAGESYVVFGSRSAFGGVLLEGTFLDLGINKDGSLITNFAAAGGVGALFDGGKDFFATGSAIANISVNATFDGPTHNLTNAGPIAITQMPSLVVMDTSAGSVHSVVVSGIVNPTLLPDLELVRTISFDDNDFTAAGGFVTVTISLTNLAEETHEDVAFLENFDPGQDLTTGATLNDVKFDGQYLQAVAPTSPAGLTFAIAHSENNGLTSSEGSTLTTNPFDVLDSPFDPNGVVANRSASIAFDFGDIDDGETVTAEYLLIFATSPAEAEAIFLQGSPDFGDAPDSYTTLLVSGGPSHLLSGPTLGTLRDGEGDAGFPLNGFGDDLTGDDDEDGVAAPSPIARHGSGSVVVNAPAGGMLDAWIDFDANGMFDGDEQLGGGSIILTAGSNTIPFTAPADTPITTTTSYGRFRVSTTGGLGIGGLALDGEVEDVRLTISASPECVFVDDDYGNPTPGTAIDGGIFGFDRFSDISTAVAVVASGGEVKVYPGNYPESVSVTRDVTIRGTSTTAGDAVVDPTAGNGFDVAAGTTVVFENLRITDAVDGISAGNVTSLTLTNIELIDNTDDGLDVDGTDGTAVISLNDVVATGNGGEGIDIDPVLDVVVSGGTYSSNVGHGILLDDVRDVTVQNISAELNGLEGLHVRTARDVMILSSLFGRNTDDGIELDDVEDVTLFNVTSEDNDFDGMDVDEALTVLVTGGSFSNNGLTGLEADNISVSVTLLGAAVNGNGSDGADIDPSGSILINGGSYSGNAGHGIELDDVQDVTVRNVTANGNTQDGLNVRNTFGKNVLVRDSALTGNGSDGIELEVTGNVDVRNVTATGNGQDGLDTSRVGIVRVRGGDFSGIMTRNTTAFITLNADVTSTKRVDVEARDGISLNSGLDATNQTVRLAANVLPSGNQSFGQSTNGFVRTTNDTDSAIVITVNNGLLGGSGDARIRELTAGTGAGRITINAGMGGIRDFDPTGVNLTAGEALLTALDGVGVVANAIESRISRVEGSGGNGAFVLDNTGPLTIGNVDVGTMGVSASGDVRITTASPMVVAEDVTSGANVILTATDSAATGDDLTVKTTITVSAGADATLTAGDNLLLEDSSTVAAPAGTVFLFGDNPDADPGVGSMIDVFGTITSGSQAVITGGPDNDQITIDPGVGHTVDSTLIDGQDGGDLYRVVFGRLTGGAAAIDIVDSGTSGNDRGRFLGTPGLAETFDVTNNDANGVNPQTGGSVLSVTEGEQVNYTETLERFTVRGRSQNDTFNVQPSQTAEITIDGDNPSFGDPGVPPGDTLNFDPLGNTFILDGKTILTNGGSPNPFLPINFRDIESFPLNPLGTSDPISFDFEHSNTASSVQVSPTQTGYVPVLRDTLYSDGLGFGWQSAVHSFERDDGYYSGPFEALIRDGHALNANGIFTVDLDNGWYSVDVTLGNAYTSVTGQEIRDNDTGDVLASGIDSPPAVSTQATFAVLVTDGTLDLEFIQPTDSPDIFSVNGIAIRPANLLTMGLNLTGVGALGADGVTTDTFRLHAAPADSYVTVSIDLGQIVNVDADPDIDGIQVPTDSNGEADIMILRPSGTGEALVKFVDVNGQGLGCSLLNYVLPETRNFDFNHGAQIHAGIFQSISPTQAPVATGSFPGGFLSVLSTDLYLAQNGFGWLTSPYSFDDGATSGTLGDLRRDGASSNVAQTFRVDLPPGDYDALATFGDSQDHDGITLDVNGVNKIAGVSTTATSHIQVPFSFSVGGNGIAEFEFSDTVGHAYWVVNGLQIRPRAEVLSFVFTPDVGAVPADGLTIATVQATTLLTDGEEVTISTSAGTIITPDVNDGIEGVQIDVSGGSIAFDIVAPGTPATPTLTATSLDGEHNTTVSDPTLLDFVLAPSRRFDFNHTYSADGPGPSITAAGFIGVLRTDVDPSSGHGWLSSPNSFDAGVPNEDDDSLSNAFNVLTTDLYRDYHSGHQVLGSRTFRVQVDSGALYDGTVYVGSQNFDASTKVTIEGIAATTTNTTAGEFVVVAFTAAMDTGADGFLDITFENGNGPSPLWATPGVDLIQQGQPFPLPAPIVAGRRLAGGHVDPVPRDHVDFVVDIAIAAWEDNGATAEEIALLESTPIIIRDFGRNGALGLTTPLGQVVIDDDGAGHGWSLQLDLTSGDRYDLLTVITHEFGHILGRPDVDPITHPDNLMSAYLPLGDRHDSLGDTDDFFADALDEYLPFQ